VQNVAQYPMMWKYFGRFSVLVVGIHLVVENLKDVLTQGHMSDSVSGF
jgi:hypothetical protein